MLNKVRYRISIFFSVFVWTGGNDSNTLRLDAYFLENGEKISVLSQKYPKSCGRGLKFSHGEKTHLDESILNLDSVPKNFNPRESYMHLTF